MEPVGQQDEQHRGADRAAHVGECGADGDGAQQAVAEDEAQALGDLRPQVGVLAGLRPYVGAADPGEGEEGEDEGGRVDDECHRCGDGCHDRAADAGAAHLDDVPGGLQLDVALDQLLVVDQVRQVALEGRVEEGGAHRHAERHHVQLAQCQHVQPGRQGDRGEQQGAAGVADQHHPPLAHPVHPCADWQADQQCGEVFEDDQQARLERRSVQGLDRHQRQRDQGHARADLADRVTGPEAAEVPVPEQA